MPTLPPRVLQLFTAHALVEHVLGHYSPNYRKGQGIPIGNSLWARLTPDEKRELTLAVLPEMTRMATQMSEMFQVLGKAFRP